MKTRSVPSRLSALTLVFVIIVSDPRRCSAVSESIIGSRETCDIEGEDFTVDKIPDTRCFTCICKNGFVECRKQQCPSIEGCYTLMEPRKDECCRRCKGCVRNGVHHESDTEWTEPNEPCKILTCKAGVITESKLRCYTPCANPIPAPPGQCCPICAGCYVNGQKVTAERTVTTTEDPCVTCRCNMGRLTCAKKACPVLHCPASSLVHSFTIRENNSTKTNVHGVPALIQSSRVQEKLVRFWNAPVNIKRRLRDAVVRSVLLSRKAELLAPTEDELTGQNGETWKLDPCKACACMQGTVRCAMSLCPPLNTPCPPNTRFEHPEGQCCPRCVESDGVCTVFGDPHYRTFDGKFYSFNGACKYQLVADCIGHTFGIRVTNDARSTKSSAWTKTITLKIGDMRINLGQKMRVKVNGMKIDVPYREPNRIDINRTMDSILVSTHIGVKVLWDGISFIEVSVPTTYRGKLCGLCGNFNLLPKDDFTTRRGRVLQDSHAFGQSWAVGSKKSCTRARPGTNVDRERRCRGRKDHKLCNRLRSQIFDACHKKVNPTMYYKSCLQDMCECPTENCYCESFVAYVHECQRLGIQLPHWRKSTRCRSVWDTMTGPTNIRRRLR
ncbi:BMP-binding endothelial regulator protein isoform X2 [Venturia canescens]|uniref:BMP-binding endothelial regulator protein isoform X2 n=1 Tax=Venturia canescens TaxID=32260 RepID=UPI001C9CF5A5|nr:BMP-binding endothelial regulator protein isoform X2 [Venturia canescens]